MSKKVQLEGDYAESARRRMQRWLLSPQLREHMQTSGEEPGRPSKIGPYIAISRESGAGGGNIARLLGQRLDWDVLDKELLDFLAQRYSMPRDMLELVDETKANWVHDVLGNWFDARVVSHEKYVVYLERILMLAALHGNVVVVGRAGHCILPREDGLSVRIVAPKKYRIEQIMERRNLDRSEAEETIAEIDEGRKDFCHRYFNSNLNDPHQYDLTINAERIAPEAAVELIVEAYRHLKVEPLIV